jgi:hypothetical protein
MALPLSRTERIRPEFVEFVPSELEDGVLYISEKYRTAVHLCCCGCRSKVVTPLKPYAWRLTTKDGAVTLRPSIGNWSFRCKSHYWISSNRVEWAGAFTDEEIAQVRVGDQLAKEQHFQPPRASLWRRFLAWLNG